MSERGVSKAKEEGDSNRAAARIERDGRKDEGITRTSIWVGCVKWWHGFESCRDLQGS